MAAPPDEPVRLRVPVAELEREVRTERYERGILRGKQKADIAQRVCKFVAKDLDDRRFDNDLRIQRYAKMRGWREGRTWPWDDASDVAITDMMSTSLSMQDTLTNAVMSTRPALVSRAIRREDEPQQETLDQLIDFQVFIEQAGEKMIGELAEDFWNDGRYVLYVPWVKETKAHVDVKFFPERPADMLPRQWFERLIERVFPTRRGSRPVGANGEAPDGWDWQVVERDGTRARVSFYTHVDQSGDRAKRQIKMRIEHRVPVYDGPKLIVKHYHEVLFPFRAENLQPPGPSNPRGATHVILIDHPTLDDLKKDVKRGFYNMVTLEELNKLDASAPDKEDETGTEDALDDFSGNAETGVEHEPSHRVFTRYLCFDLYDLNNDGVNEDVVWWVLKERKLLLKAAPLGEIFPSRKPRRPLAESVMLPVRGRAIGISGLELQEPIHDLKKQLFDLMIDSGSIASMPFGFYRPTSNLQPTTLRPGPGDLLPLSDPQRDIFIPQLGDANQAFTINALALADRMDSDLTLIGDLQKGRIPRGQSAALRTSGGIQQVLAQSEARPERILRRFFMGLVQAWQIIHEANRNFLRPGKRIRIAGAKEPQQDPYIILDEEQVERLDMDVDFDFHANILNSSKIALQQALQEVIGLYMHPLPLQAGVIGPGGIHRLLVDFADARAVNGEKYLNQLPPQEALPKITWIEALTIIVGGRVPEAFPLEPPQEHLQSLLEWAATPQQGVEPPVPHMELLTPGQQTLFQQWAVRVGGFIQQMQLAAAAPAGPGGQPGRPGEAPVGEEPGVQQPGQPVDGTLPAGTGTP